ncbi:hypothetical protein Tco_1330156 [Tanacetum coccineum]
MNIDEEMKVCPILGEAVSWKLGGDVESLRDELAKLKLAKEVLFCPCGVVAIMEAKGKIFGNEQMMKVVSSSRSFGSAVLGQMTYLVASSTLDSARSYVMQGASFTQGTVSSIPIGGNISPGGFSPSILLVVILVTVVIVVVVLVVVVIGVVIVVAIIGVVFVVGGVSFIIKLSFVIIVWGLEAVTFPSMLLGNPPMKASRSFLVFGWAYVFHQDKASSVRVPVPNVTLFSSAHLLRENTDSVRSNQRIRLTAPSVPLK